MPEPKRIPLTDNPRCKEPTKIRLTKIDSEIWEQHEINCGPPVFAKPNEDHQQNNTTSVSELESDKTY